MAYSECRDEVAVLLYIVEGGGHTWPGAADVARLGNVTQEIDATDLIWEFFEAHPYGVEPAPSPWTSGLPASFDAACEIF